MPEDKIWFETKRLETKLSGEGRKKDITITLDEKTIIRLKWMAEKYKVSKSEVIRQITKNQYEFEKTENNLRIMIRELINC